VRAAVAGVALQLGCFAGLAVLGAISSSCVAADATTTGSVPDSNSFITNDVSLFMERRCGSLDCHGQTGRPMRLYSVWGLRLDTGTNGARDTSATTDKERLENYRAVVGLEPERLEEIFTTPSGELPNFDNYQLLLKPLDIVGGGVRHKGGPVLRQTTSDDGWVCLSGWVTNNADKVACDNAANITQ